MSHEIVIDGPTRLPPKERLLVAARELFYVNGIRAVGVDAIAEAAGTNKMSLYRHFDSKDNLVAEYLRQVDEESEGLWADLEAAHPEQPIEQVKAWLCLMARFATEGGHRGCAFANAAAELPDSHHPARAVIEEHGRRLHDHITQRLQDGGIREAEKVTDQLLMLVDGAQVSCQTVGPNGPSRSLRDLALGLIDSSLRDYPAA